MDVEIRPARPDDAEFLAWLILTAGRAHVKRGIWEVILGGTEQGSLEFLNLLAVTATPHLFHYSCEKHGFKIVDEKRHPDFEAEIGSPGMALMLRNL